MHVCQGLVAGVPISVMSIATSASIYLQAHLYAFDPVARARRRVAYVERVNEFKKRSAARNVETFHEWLQYYESLHYLSEDNGGPFLDVPHFGNSNLGHRPRRLHSSVPLHSLASWGRICEALSAVHECPGTHM